jgi:hypothetical protein
VVVPSDHGVGSDDDQTGYPLTTGVFRRSLEVTVGALDPRSPVSVLEDSDLLLQDQVIEYKVFA